MFASSIEKSLEVADILSGPGEHRLIFEAIKNHNFEKAKLAIRKSLHTWKEYGHIVKGASTPSPHPAMERKKVR